MLSTHTLAQISLTIDFNGIHRKVNEKVRHESWHSDWNTHVAPYLRLRACRAPNTYVVQSAQPPLILICMTELKVTKSGKARIGARGYLTFLEPIDIESEHITFDDDSNVIPTGGTGKDIAYIQAV